MAAGLLLADMTDNFLLSRMRARYTAEKNSGAKTDDTTLEYAWCMVRSPQVKDMREGLKLLRSLLSESCPRNDTELRKGCYQGLAIGHSRLKEFLESFRAIQNLHQIDPNDPKVKELALAVEKKVNSEAIKGGITILSVLTAVDSVAAFAFRLLR